MPENGLIQDFLSLPSEFNHSLSPILNQGSKNKNKKIWDQN